jgi:hypothetical protein
MSYRDPHDASEKILARLAPELLRDSGMQLRVAPGRVLLIAPREPSARLAAFGAFALAVLAGAVWLVVRGGIVAKIAGGAVGVLGVLLLIGTLSSLAQPQASFDRRRKRISIRLGSDRKRYRWDDATGVELDRELSSSDSQGTAKLLLLAAGDKHLLFELWDQSADHLARSKAAALALAGFLDTKLIEHSDPATRRRLEQADRRLGLDVSDVAPPKLGVDVEKNDAVDTVATAAAVAIEVIEVLSLLD